MLNPETVYAILMKRAKNLNVFEKVALKQCHLACDENTPLLRCPGPVRRLILELTHELNERGGDNS